MPSPAPRQEQQCATARGPTRTGPQAALRCSAFELSAVGMAAGALAAGHLLLPAGVGTTAFLFRCVTS